MTEPAEGLRCSWIGRVALAAVLVLLLAGSLRAGMGVASAGRALLTILLLQVFPGVVLWRAIWQRPRSAIEDVVAGLAIGAGLAALGVGLAGALGAPAAGPLVPPVTAGLVLGSGTARRRVRAPSVPMARHWGWGVGTALAHLPLLPAIHDLYVRTPVNWDSGFRDTYPDMTFHQGIAAQLATRGPDAMPHVLGQSLDYHWLSHAWTAATGLASGVELDVVMFRVFPPVFTVGVVVTVAVLATRLTGRWVAGPLAAAIAVTAGHLDVSGVTRVNVVVSLLSPSTTFAILLLLVAVAVLAARWDGKRAGGSTALLGLLGIAIAGAKGPTAVILVGGAIATSAIALLLRLPARRWIVRDTLLLVGGFLVAYVLVLGADSHGTMLDLRAAAVDASRHLGIDEATVHGSSLTVTAAIAVITLVAVLARGAGLVLALLSPDGRHRPLPWLLLGAGLAGAGAVVVFSHAGASQFYFLRSAVPLLAIGSVVGLLESGDRLQGRRFEMTLIGVVLGAVGLVLGQTLLGAAPSAGDDRQVLLLATAQLALFFALLAGVGVAVGRWAGNRRGLPAMHTGLFVVVVAILTAAVLPSLRVVLVQPGKGPVDVASPPTAPHAFAADQVEAARWVRDTAATDDVVVTNRHCARAVQEPCDPRRFFVTAFTQRQVLVEGWAYTPRWSATPDPPAGRFFRPFWDQELLATNDAFFAADGEAASDRLWELGVRWAFEDRTVSGDRPPLDHADLEVETEWARVYSLRSPDS